MVFVVAKKLIPSMTVEAIWTGRGIAHAPSRSGAARTSQIPGQIPRLAPGKIPRLAPGQTPGMARFVAILPPALKVGLVIRSSSSLRLKLGRRFSGPASSYKYLHQEAIIQDMLKGLNQ